MSKKIVLIKLGGSLITDKEKPFTAKFKVIKNLAKQIADSLKEDKNLSLIIGNGGGSFPHYPAVNYQVKQGIKNNNQKLGFCEVQDAASRLNRIIVRALLDYKVKAISMNPSSMIIARKGKIKKFFIEPILAVLNMGLVPIIYGDIVFDEVKGATIFSTEQLLNYLVLYFKKNNLPILKVVHNGITRGVLDSEGKIIKKISYKNWFEIKKFFTEIKGFDVTGGMKHKVEEALRLTRYEVKTLIINGNIKNNLLKKAILEDKIEGTVIE